MFTSQCRRCQVCLKLLFWRRRRRLQKQCVLLTTSSSPRPFYFGTPAHTRVAGKTFRLPEAATACQSSPVHIFFLFPPPVSVPSRQTDTQTERKARCHQFRNTVSLLDSRDAIAPGLHGEKQRAGTQFFVRGENETLHLISSPFPASPDRDSKSAGAVLGKKGEDKQTNGTKKKRKRKRNRQVETIVRHSEVPRRSGQIRQADV